MDPEAASHWVSDYEQAVLERLDPVGFTVNPQVACCLPMLCHEDEATALERARGRQLLRLRARALPRVRRPRPGRHEPVEGLRGQAGRAGLDPIASVALQQKTLGAKLMAGETPAGLRGAVGTPAQLREFMRRYEEAGVDLMLFSVANAGISHEHVCESLEKFGSQVLPEFRERDAEQRAAKEARLAPAIEAALERRSKAVVPEVPEGYSIAPVFREKLREVLSDEAIAGDLGGERHRRRRGHDRHPPRRGPGLHR